MELLSEGLAPSAGSLTETIASKPRRQRRPAPSQSGQSSRRSESEFSSAINRTVRAASGDPIMQSILEDTARGTYQTMAAADRRNPAMASMEGGPGGLNLASMASAPLGSAGGAGAVAGANAMPEQLIMAAQDPINLFEQLAEGSSSKWAALAFTDHKPK